MSIWDDRLAGWQWHFRRFFVPPEYRPLGVADRLAREVFRLARLDPTVRELHAVIHEGNDRSRKFTEFFGLERIGGWHVIQLKHEGE